MKNGATYLKNFGDRDLSVLCNGVQHGLVVDPRFFSYGSQIHFNSIWITVFRIFHQRPKHRDSAGIRLLKAPIQRTESAGDATVVGAVIAFVGCQGTKGYINVNEEIFCFQNGAFKRMMGVTA